MRQGADRGGKGSVVRGFPFQRRIAVPFGVVVARELFAFGVFDLEPCVEGRTKCRCRDAEFEELVLLRGEGNAWFVFRGYDYAIGLNQSCRTMGGWYR